MPSLTPFRDDIFNISGTLVSIATETEQTAEKFRRDKSNLEDSGQYYRFNVDRRLEDVGLEESKKRKEIAAATRRYVASQGVLKQMQACAGNITGREYFGEYRIAFSLKGVPRVSKLIARPGEMGELERVLLPEQKTCRQKIFVLRGLGGIGKAQLAVEFASQHQRKFSAVFWLDGNSKESIMQSIASCASRIPEGQISHLSRTYSTGSEVDINIVILEVIGWLSREHNVKWLLIFDNVDRYYDRHASDSKAYDITQYFSGTDHGSVLIATRLAKLEQYGASQELGKVNQDQARAILQTRYKGKYDVGVADRLLSLLDGLPLAIAQAGAFLQETSTELQKYIEFYEQKWKELMKSRNLEDPLQDYPDRSVWTTWTLSYNTIRDRNVFAANLLLLWAFLDRKGLWYGLFAAACNASTAVASSLTDWIGDIAGSELEFTEAVRLLRNYSLIEMVEGKESYATHPVVHRWAYNFQSSDDSRAQLVQLAVMVVGWAVPHSSLRDYSALQRRILPHAQACSQWVGTIDTKQGTEHTSTLLAVHNLGSLYRNQGKLVEAQQMYERALQGYEKALGAEHTSTLGAVNNLGSLYADQGKLGKAQQMFQRALQGYEKALGAEHTSTLGSVHCLGILYVNQGKLAEAQQMFQRALQGYEKVFGPDHLKSQEVQDKLIALHSVENKSKSK